MSRGSSAHDILGVAAIASESEERAEALARANDLAMVRLMQNRPGPVPTPEEAAERAELYQ